MLHAHLVSRGITPGRDIAQRPDVWGTGTARVVADHTVVDLDTAAVEPVGGRVRADADHHQVGGDFGAVGEHHGVNTAFAADLGHPDAGAHVHALVAVQAGHQSADLL